MKDHVEAEFNHFRRGKSHTTPDWEKDVANLQEAYRVGKAHVYQTVRVPKVDTSPPDFINIGIQKLNALVNRWTAKRVTQKSTEENYEERDPEVSREEESVVDLPEPMSGLEVSTEDEIAALLMNLRL